MNEPPDQKLIDTTHEMLTVLSRAAPGMSASDVMQIAGNVTANVLVTLGKMYPDRLRAKATGEAMARTVSIIEHHVERAIEQDLGTKELDKFRDARFIKSLELTMRESKGSLFPMPGNKKGESK